MVKLQTRIFGPPRPPPYWINFAKILVCKMNWVSKYKQGFLVPPAPPPIVSILQNRSFAQMILRVEKRGRGGAAPVPDPIQKPGGGPASKSRKFWVEMCAEHT